MPSYLSIDGTGDSDDFTDPDNRQKRKRKRNSNRFQNQFGDNLDCNYYRKFLCPDIRDVIYEKSQDRKPVFRSHFRVPLKTIDDLTEMHIRNGWVNYTQRVRHTINCPSVHSCSLCAPWSTWVTEDLIANLRLRPTCPALRIYSSSTVSLRTCIVSSQNIFSIHALPRSFKLLCVIMLISTFLALEGRFVSSMSNGVIVLQETTTSAKVKSLSHQLHSNVSLTTVVELLGYHLISLVREVTNI
jgi:hypothetical protein